MFPSKGTPGGCGICVVIVKSAVESIYIGNRDSIEKEVRLAENCEKFEEVGGSVAYKASW